MSSAAYHFLPWVRQGMPAGIVTPETLDSSIATRASTPITVRLSSRVPGADPVTDDVTMSMQLYGPGDVIGFDPREVVRTVPLHQTLEYPPHLFAAIEFDRPDFLWLFTPAAPSADKLRPWVALVVVPRDDATIAYNAGRSLPELTCRREDLPDLTESWMWGHAQFAGARDVPDVASALLANPAQTVSRLMCPRRLTPGVGYLACVVPAFAIGRKAGLGEPISEEDEARLDPAWNLETAPETVTLPVYYSWEFATAATEGDFEDLVDRLQLPGEEVLPRAGLIDMSRPGRGLPEIDGATLGLHSALHLPGTITPGWPGDLAMTFEQFQASLRGTLSVPNGSGNRVSPPIYGSIHALGPQVDAGRALDATVPKWLRTLNLDPRYRVAASLGAQVVRTQEDQLMSAAWRQAGEIADANRWLAQKQLAREVSHSVFEKRLKALSPGSLQQIMAPVVAPGGDNRATMSFAMARVSTASAEAPVSGLRNAVTSASFRRIARPESPIARRATLAAVVEGPGSLQGTIGQLMTSMATSTMVIESGLSSDSQVETQRFSAFSAETATLTSTAEPTSPASDTLELLQRLDPERTYAVEARARVRTTDLASAPSGAEPLAAQLMKPTFPQPMYEPMRDMFRNMLLPGLDNIPNNSVMLLGVNTAFIEAYMVGLNDEMSRELLWQEFPADLQSTHFRQFWDVRSQLRAGMTEAEREGLYDIPPIASWGRDAELGSNMEAKLGSNLIMLLIKGDLLLRFPTAVIFATPARWSSDGSGPAVVDEARENTDRVFPSLFVDPVPGVRLLGFDIAGGSTAAVGDDSPPGNPGWFIVIQEHPTEPRFGLNLNRVDPLTTWRKLAWSDVAFREESRYIDATDVVPALTGTPTPADKSATWARTAADMAYITLQKAYRLEVHAGHWLS